jgi:hypothetical protein
VPLQNLEWLGMGAIHPQGTAAPQLGRKALEESCQRGRRRLRTLQAAGGGEGQGGAPRQRQPLVVFDLLLRHVQRDVAPQQLVLR